MHYWHNVISVIKWRRCTCLEKFSLQFFSPCFVEFLALDEAVGHALEVLLRDRSVLVEVDPLEVRLHLAHPKVRHGCWQTDVRARRRADREWRDTDNRASVRAVTRRVMEMRKLVAAAAAAADVSSAVSTSPRLRVPNHPTGASRSSLHLLKNHLCFAIFVS